MCLFAILAGLAPRIAFAILWLARPNVVAAAFGDVLLWPLLGLVFLPFTTLMYTILWVPAASPAPTGCGWASPSSSISGTTRTARTATGIACPVELRPRPPRGRRSRRVEARLPFHPR